MPSGFLNKLKMKFLPFIYILVSIMVSSGKCEFVSKIYEGACDRGIREVKAHHVVARLTSPSLVECLPKCAQNPNCVSVDFVTDRKSSNCVLIYFGYRSNCQRYHTVKHFIWVRALSLEVFILYFINKLAGNNLGIIMHFILVRNTFL